MANNRMWLIHRPTGEAIYLGKRMGFGWYYGNTRPTKKKFDDFYKRCSEADVTHGGNQDDFVLIMEDISAAPCVTKYAYYDDDNKPVIMENALSKSSPKLGIDWLKATENVISQFATFIARRFYLTNSERDEFVAKIKSGVSSIEDAKRVSKTINIG